MASAKLRFAEAHASRSVEMPGTSGSKLCRSWGLDSFGNAHVIRAEANSDAAFALNDYRLNVIHPHYDLVFDGHSRIIAHVSLLNGVAAHRLIP